MAGISLFSNPDMGEKEDPLPIKYDIFEYVEKQRDFTMKMLEEKDVEVQLEKAIKVAVKKAEKEKARLEKLERDKAKSRRAFLNATFVIETGNGSSYMWKHMNNPGGLKCNGPGQRCSSDNYRYFSSKEEGMREKERLLQGYFDKYGDDFKTIREIYCQCGPDDYPKFMKIYYQELNKL